MAERIELQIGADLNPARDDIEGFVQRIKSSRAVELSVNAAGFKEAIYTAQQELRRLRDIGDKEGAIKISANIERLKQELTQANRELRNFSRTGEADVSVLGKLFEGVNRNIEQTRTTLLKLGKGTEGLDTLGREVQELNKQFDAGKVSIQEYGKRIGEIDQKIGGLTNNTKSVSAWIVEIAKGFVAFTFLDKLRSGLASTIKDAMSFESAFSGVRKTLNGSEADFQQIESGVRAMSARIPIAVEELGKIGELGAQLGVPKEALLDFTETVAKLGVTTNLTTEEAATAFAQIASIMQIPLAEVSNMGSAVVGLGNNFATTESQIVDFSSRIAGAGTLVGLTSADVFGIATAFSSVGIEAEAGGTAVSEGLITIQKAVSDGGSELEKFATLTGQTAGEFAKNWKDSAAEQFTEVIEGISQAGDKAAPVIESLFGSSARLFRAFASAATSGDTLRRAIELSNTEFEKNVALQEEAQKKFATTENQLLIQENRWRLLGAFLGGQFLPVITSVTSFFTETIPSVLIKTNAALVLLIAEFANAYERISAFFADLPYNAWVFGRNLVRVFGIIGDNIGTFGRNAQKIFEWLGENIGITFGNIGPWAKMGLNLAIDAVESWVNKAIGLVNQLTEKLKTIPVVGGQLANTPKIGPVSISRFATDDSRAFSSPKSDLESFTSITSWWQESFRDSSIPARQLNDQVVDATYLEAEKALQELQGITWKSESDNRAQIRKDLETEQQKIRDLLKKIEDEKKGKWDSSNKNPETERKVKDLEEQARKEIEFINASIRTEQEKADAIKVIEERLQDDTLKARGETLQLTLRQNERRVAALKNESDAQKEADKEERDRQEKYLQWRASVEKKAVADSTMLASEKARHLKEIDERLAQDLARIKGDQSKAEAESAEARVARELEAEKQIRDAKEATYKKTVGSIEDDLWDVKKLAEAYDDFGDKLEEVSRKGVDEIKKLSDEIGELHDKIAQTVTTGQQSLASRGLDVVKERAAAEKELAGLQAKGASLSEAQQIGRPNLALMEQAGGSTFKDGSVTSADFLKALDLAQQIEDLNRENDLINANTTEAERGKALEDSKKSKAQQILEETAAKKADLEADLIAVEARKKAKEEEIEAEKKAIQDKKELILKRIEDEKTETKNLYDNLREQDAAYTAAFGAEVEERKKYLDSLREKAEAAQAALQSAELMKASAANAASVGNTTNVNTTANIYSGTDAESFLRWLNRAVN